MSDDVRVRKLQPIYNALDARNYKMAIKLCGKKDMERWDIVKTLKAHALERMGRVEEALDLCREVASRQPRDETVSGGGGAGGRRRLVVGASRCRHHDG